MVCVKIKNTLCHECIRAVLRLVFEFSTSEWTTGGAYCTVANDSQQVIEYDKVRTQRSSADEIVIELDVIISEYWRTPGLLFDNYHASPGNRLASFSSAQCITESPAELDISGDAMRY